MRGKSEKRKRASGRGATLLLVALFTTVTVGMVAFAVDLGHIVLARTQLQVSADSAAVAATAAMAKPRDEMLTVARQHAGCHDTAGRSIRLSPDDVEYGIWDAAIRRFTPTPSAGNAVRITARTDRATGQRPPLFFGRVLAKAPFARTASAVALANPRDIVFLVDLSGAMNDDTEPCWATDAINDALAAEGHPTVGTDLAQDVYDDFGYGPYPGALEHLGKPWGVAEHADAYHALAEDGGPLTENAVPPRYRILPGDGDSVRKKKAYSAIIDQQIARLMPNARPVADSFRNYGYWEKYLDYVIHSPSRPPSNQDLDRIDQFSNPGGTDSDARKGLPEGFRNKLGYRTYVQFMMDYGRDLKPEARTFVPLSIYSHDCPWHWEETPGGRFRFPSREQPMHAVRRALIAALQVAKERNAAVPEPDQRDWVSIVTFDRLTGGGPMVEQPLTADYAAAMLACTRLQAVGDKGASRATEAGLLAAQSHLGFGGQAGRGRPSATKVLVLLTAGGPDLHVTSKAEIDQYASRSRSTDLEATSDYARQALLVQTARLGEEGWLVFPVGVGRGADHNLMDRLARLGHTTGQHGQSPRGSGNPAEYEQRLTDVLEEIITNPRVRLVR